MNKTIKILLIILGFILISFLFSSLLSKAQVFDQIAIIQINAPITTMSSGSPFSFSKTITPEKIISFLDNAEKDKSIKGIILEINSPGGTAVASREIASRVKSFKKPKVAWIREIGTSGAYWVASSADKIIADELSLLGSIGVTSSYLEFSDLFEKYGITYENITAGSLKDIGSPYRKLTEQERNLLLSKLKTIQDIFIEEIAKNRNLNSAQIEKISTGEFFLGKESKSLGLIDEFGSKDLAINITKKLANITEASIVTYKTKASLFEYLQQVFSYFPFTLGKGISQGFLEETRSYRFDIQA